MRAIFLLFSISFIVGCNKESKKYTHDIRHAEITYKFGDEVNRQILSTISRLDSIAVKKATVSHYGIHFFVCDVDQGNFVLSLDVIDNSPFSEHYSNTNRFADISDKFLLPVISSDLYFTSGIIGQSNLKGRTSKGRGCVEKIYFDHDYKIVKVEPCNNDL